jgi:hypothetical protein
MAMMALNYDSGRPNNLVIPSGARNLSAGLIGMEKQWSDSSLRSE